MPDWTQLMERPPDLDLGDGHVLWWFSWKPDRELNPQHEGHPDVERAGAIIGHIRPDGQPCWGGINFDLPELEWMPKEHKWQVQSIEPLTISPSVLCKSPLEGGGECGDHGFIKNGRWERA